MNYFSESIIKEIKTKCQNIVWLIENAEKIAIRLKKDYHKMVIPKKSSIFGDCADNISHFTNLLFFILNHPQNEIIQNQLFHKINEEVIYLMNLALKIVIESQGMIYFNGDFKLDIEKIFKSINSVNGENLKSVEIKEMFELIIKQKSKKYLLTLFINPFKVFVFNVGIKLIYGKYIYANANIMYMRLLIQLVKCLNKK